MIKSQVVFRKNLGGSTLTSFSEVYGTFNTCKAALVSLLVWTPHFKQKRIRFSKYLVK